MNYRIIKKLDRDGDLVLTAQCKNGWLDWWCSIDKQYVTVYKKPVRSEEKAYQNCKEAIDNHKIETARKEMYSKVKSEVIYFE